MSLTVDYRETITDRMKTDPAFARALLDEAIGLMVNAESEVARLLLRDLTHGLMGFEGLAKAMGTPSKSLHRMLSQRGNSSMDMLSGIFAELVNAAFHAPATVHVRADVDALAA